MEPFYYNHMNKNQQAVYRAMQQGLTNLSDEFQIPRLEGKDLSNVFFELRLDHVCGIRKNLSDAKFLECVGFGSDFHIRV